MSDFPEASRVTLNDMRRALRGQWLTNRPAVVIPPSLAGAYAIGGVSAGGWFIWFGSLLAVVELAGWAVLLFRKVEQTRDHRDIDDYFNSLLANATMAPLDLDTAEFYPFDDTQKPETD